MQLKLLDQNTTLGNILNALSKIPRHEWEKDFEEKWGKYFSGIAHYDHIVFQLITDSEKISIDHIIHHIDSDSDVVESYGICIEQSDSKFVNCYSIKYSNYGSDPFEGKYVTSGEVGRRLNSSAYVFKVLEKFVEKID